MSDMNAERARSHCTCIRDVHYWECFADHLRGGGAGSGLLVRKISRRKGYPHYLAFCAHAAPAAFMLRRLLLLLPVCLRCCMRALERSPAGRPAGADMGSLRLHSVAAPRAGVNTAFLVVTDTSAHTMQRARRAR